MRQVVAELTTRLFAGHPVNATPHGRKDEGSSSADGIFRAWRFAALALVLAALPWSETARAQEERATRSPDVGKVTGSSRRAFSGKVRSVDLDRKVLTLATVEGDATEFFPVKKDVQVVTPTGKKLKLKELTPGSNVIVYYKYHRDGRRTVNEIMLLSAGIPEEKKSPPPSS